MARITSITGWRSRVTGAGISGVSAVLKRKSDATTLDTATTDANGLGSHDVDYPGPHTVTLTSGGETRTIDSDVVGFAGEFSLIDLPIAFQAFTTGVLPNFLDTLDLSPGSGRAVAVGTGAVSVLGRVFVNDAALDVAIDANSSGNPRIDLLVVRLELTFSAGVREVGRRYLTKITGTPAATPAAPSPVQSADYWDVPLGQVAVANGAGSFVAGNITAPQKVWMTPQRVEASSIQAGTVAADLTVRSTSSGALVVEDASGEDKLAIDTSTADGSLNLLNGADLIVRSDLVTDVFHVDGLTGNGTQYGTHTIQQDATAALLVEREDGTDVAAVDTTNGLLRLGNPLGGLSGHLRLVEPTTPVSVDWRVGTGSPEGVVVADPGSLYSRPGGGADRTLYVKESGAGTNTGWRRVATLAP